MITPGGEVAFVTRMVEESLTLGRTKIRCAACDSFTAGQH